MSAPDLCAALKASLERKREPDPESARDLARIWWGGHGANWQRNNTRWAFVASFESYLGQPPAVRREIDALLRKERPTTAPRPVDLLYLLEVLLHASHDCHQDPSREPVQCQLCDAEQQAAALFGHKPRPMQTETEDPPF